VIPVSWTAATVPGRCSAPHARARPGPGRPHAQPCRSRPSPRSASPRQHWQTVPRACALPLAARRGDAAGLTGGPARAQAPAGGAIVVADTLARLLGIGQRKAASRGGRRGWRLPRSRSTSPAAVGVGGTGRRAPVRREQAPGEHEPRDRHDHSQRPEPVGGRLGERGRRDHQHEQGRQRRQQHDEQREQRDPNRDARPSLRHGANRTRRQSLCHPPTPHVSPRFGDHPTTMLDAEFEAACSGIQRGEVDTLWALLDERSQARPRPVAVPASLRAAAPRGSELCETYGGGPNRTTTFPPVSSCVPARCRFGRSPSSRWGSSTSMQMPAGGSRSRRRTCGGIREAREIERSVRPHEPQRRHVREAAPIERRRPCGMSAAGSASTSSATRSPGRPEHSPPSRVRPPVPSGTDRSSP